MDKEILESQDHRNLLDTIDRLRSKGINRYVDLPEIVVCGDQSAGKSSVLEAISGISFPTKDNLCTRFATELILRRDTQVGVKISIRPGSDRAKDEAERLSCVDFGAVSAESNLGELIEKAKDAMGLSDRKVFSTDCLRIEIFGNTQPHLTLVDLPGLFRAGNSEQSRSDSRIVHKMVRDYMKRPRSIILAVVSAKSDFALQEVTEFAREIDRRGVRTMGLITKPDTLDAGSDSESSYIRLARNEDVVFRLGWHVLKNRSYETRLTSSSERDQDEQNFFSSGNWASVDPASLGVASLKPRLSGVLRNQILRQLPGLLDDARAGISECRMRLERIGASRTTTEEQRRFLLQISQDFTALMRSAVGGFYNHGFFGDARTDQGFNKRLRAVVQDALEKFREDMCSNGRARVVVNFPSESSPLKSGEISRSEYLDEVTEVMRRSRGCELFGTFNPLIVGELFADLCQPWRSIAAKAKDSIVQSVVRTARAILEHITVDETADALYQMISKRIDILKKNTDDKLAELIRPHTDGHPITYNHYLIENVQKAQLKRRQEELDDVLEELKTQDSSVQYGNLNIKALRSSYARRTEVNMAKYASELAVDHVEAYYKVALKKFIDDFSVLAIEQCLMQKATALLEVQTVCELSDAQMTQITAESQKMTMERTHYAEKQAVLESGLQELEHLSGYSSSSLVEMVSSELEESVLSEDISSNTPSSPPVINNEDEDLSARVQADYGESQPIQWEEPVVESREQGPEHGEAPLLINPKRNKKVKRSAERITHGS